jgi:hypothetical protein
MCKAFMKMVKSILKKLLHTMHKPSRSHTHATFTRHHHNI